MNQVYLPVVNCNDESFCFDSRWLVIVETDIVGVRGHPRDLNPQREPLSSNHLNVERW